MSRWYDEQPPSPAPRPSLAMDLMGAGPASTPARELLAAVLQIGAVALLLFVVFPDRLGEAWRWLVMAALVAYFVVRAAAGIPKWRRRR